MTRDAYTVRTTALFQALNVLTPLMFTGLPGYEHDLSDQKVLTMLERASDNLTELTTTVLGVDVAGEPVDAHKAARDLVNMTIIATRWTQQLVHALGGIHDTDLLVDAVVHAAAYQLALKLRCRAHQDLGKLADIVLSAANSPA